MCTSVGKVFFIIYFSENVKRIPSFEEEALKLADYFTASSIKIKQAITRKRNSLTQQRNLQGGSRIHNILCNDHFLSKESHNSLYKL